jgi:hypothetical protein
MLPVHKDKAREREREIGVKNKNWEGEDLLIYIV